MTDARFWVALMGGVACAGLIALAALFAGLVLSVSPAAYLPVLLVFVIPLTVCVAVVAGWGGPSLGLWLVLVAWGAAALAVGPAEAVFIALMAVAGLVLAAAVRGQWSFGRALAALTGLLAAASGAHSLVHREDIGRLAGGFLGTWVYAGELAAAGEANADKQVQLKALSQSLRELQAHWPSLGFGLGVMLLLMAALTLVVLTAVVMRRGFGRAAFRGSFPEMRPPDTLVWVAIGCVALGFVDWRWGVPAARHIAWNGGIVLSAVYFLNGVAVLAYILGRAGSRMLIPLALLVVLGNVWLYPMLSLVGLFDTWGEFRARFERLLALARERAEKGNDGEG